MSSAAPLPAAIASSSSIAAWMRAPGVMRSWQPSAVSRRIGDRLIAPSSHILPVVWRFPRDRDVMHMALAQAGRGDLDEFAIALHLGDRPVAGIAHGGAQPADQLMDDIADRPLMR